MNIYGVVSKYGGSEHGQVGQNTNCPQTHACGTGWANDLNVHYCRWFVGRRGGEVLRGRNKLHLF